MSDVGFMELIVLFAIGLIVLGPERLPRVANKLGGWVGQARRMTRVMKRQLEDELNFEKDFSIKPPARTQHANPVAGQPAATPQREQHDDSYSPAHDADAVGTGVGSELSEPQEPAPAESADVETPDDEREGPA